MPLRAVRTIIIITIIALLPGVRFSASKINIDTIQEIKKYVKPLPQLQLYKEVIASTFKSKTRLQRDEVKQLSVQLEEANKRLSKARDLLLAGDIEAHDYRAIKSESDEKIHRLEAKLTASVTDTTDIEPLLNKAISNISQLDVLYINGSTIQKRKIISSMFPEKLTLTDFNIELIASMRRLGLSPC